MLIQNYLKDHDHEHEKWRDLINHTKATVMTKKKRSTKAKSASNGKGPAKVTSYRELPIKDLEIERFQVRKQNVGQNLDELAASIEKHGLLQPIVVCKS